MNNLVNYKTFFLLILISSLSVIISAIYIEYILKQNPCELCIYQRYPWLFGIFVSFFGYYFEAKKICLFIILFLLLISATLSGYHVGVEKGYFSGLSGCSNNNLGILDKNQLLNSLEDISVSCKDVTFRLFGMSLALINFIFSMILFISALVTFKYEKNR